MLSRFRLRRRIRRRNRDIVDALYHGLVEHSRQPKLFAAFGIPDTVMGRFEALCLHMFLALERCRDDAALGALSQDLVDRFISDIEDSIREIGIGDVAVPKRMRRLTGMFYERVAAYEPPLVAGDLSGLATKLERFALADAAERDALGLAADLVATRTALAAVPAATILDGHLFDAGAAAE